MKGISVAYGILAVVAVAATVGSGSIGTAAPLSGAAVSDLGTPGWTLTPNVHPSVQGEGNSAPNFSTAYQGVLADIIADWRRRWGVPLPFYVVQLHGIGPTTSDPAMGSDTAIVRQAQLKDALSIPDTSLVIAIDLGDAAGDLHPPDKVDVADRLADLVSHGATGPPYAGYSVEGAAIHVRFTHAEGGLTVRGAALRGFAIAGSDKRFEWARAHRR